jgi:hypothetical protein
MAKVKVNHVPYRGSAPALQGLLVDRDPQALCGQRVRGEQSADAAADNDNF